MEGIKIILDPDNNGKDFDEALKNTLPEAGDLSVIVKHNGTVNGNSLVMMKFSVQLPDGKIATAQAVTTAKLFDSAAAAVRVSVARFQAMKGMN